MDPHNSSKVCNDTVLKLLDSYNGSHEVFGKYNITFEALSNLTRYCNDEKLTEESDNYSEPVVWVGYYIGITSMLCSMAMEKDRRFGFENKKYWFPCKLFSLNAASITLITITMKLPWDLSNPMPTDLDQATKLGSLAFMCTMMANFMPSLGSMAGNTLLTNIMGLVILVITLIMNICIETVTGVIHDGHFKLATYIYISLMFLLLLILISSSITILTTKETLELECQARSRRISNDQHLGLSMENLRKHVRRYWIMAESCSPQFVMANSPLSIASGIICAVSLVFYLVTFTKILLDIPPSLRSMENTSVYKKSIGFIFGMQYLGILIGSIAPIYRCFTILSVRANSIWNSNHVVVFRVEAYWTKKLFEWKESPLPFRITDQVVHELRNFLLSLGIIIQKVVVVSCKIIELVMGIVLIFVVICSYCWNPSSNDTEEDLCNYVLQIQGDEVELAKRISREISYSMNHVMERVKRGNNENLLELLENSSGFEGVKKFDNNQFPSPSSVANVNGWSLPLITLTCIAITLPEVPEDRVKKFLKGVGHGLSYTHVMEKNLNTSSEHVHLQEASMKLWHEVEDTYKWLGNPLEGSNFDGKASEDVLNWFVDKAQEIVTANNASTDMLIVANSMYRIAKTILYEYITNNQIDDQGQLFRTLSCMIADILSACLIANIPELIRRTCHESLMEKEREASVRDVAVFIGMNEDIITKLEARQVPRIDPSNMIFIDEWRRHLMTP